MMRGAKFVTVVLWLGAWTAGWQLAPADEPVYFRCHHGLADDPARAIPAELDPASAQWKQTLPGGHSTPTIVGERIFVTGCEGNELQTVCLDRATGEVLWSQSQSVDALEKFHPEGSPAAATVAYQDGRVFSFFGSYGLLCYDLDGKPLWAKPMGPFRDEFGSASSPVLAQGMVFLCEDHDLDSYLIAISQATGETVWQTSREGFTRSYSTPVIWNAGGKPQLVVSGALELVDYDLATGEKLWSRDGFARIVNTTPTIAGDMLYVATWSPGGDADARIAMEPWDVALGMWDENRDGRLQNAELPAGEVRSRFFRIDLDGSDSLEQAEWDKYAQIFERAQNTMVALKADPTGGPPQLAWEYKRGLPYVASPLVYGDRVILVKDGGVVTVLNAQTGKLIKQARSRGSGNFYASPVVGGGKLLVASVGGVLTVFDAREPFAIEASFEFGDRLAATPVITDGKVYVRTERSLYCFGPG
jgi:outer membrane protein assembly factor BamB